MLALLSRALVWALAALLLAGALLFAAVSWKMLTYRHEVVVSEGAVSLGVRSILDGVPPYDPVRFEREPFVILPYTPLYYLLTAPVMALTKAPFAAGRLVSIAFTLGGALAAGFIAARLTGFRRPGTIAALLWLSFYQVVFWGTAQRVDAAAIFLELVGLAIALSEREKGRLPWAALPPFVLAWATNQLMVAGLVAVTLDLFLRDRRGGLRIAAAAAGSLAAAFVLLSIGTHGTFWRATVLGAVSAHPASARPFFGSPWNVLLFALAGIAAWRRRERLLGVYLGLGLALAIATEGSFPRFFAPMAAIAILVPVLLCDAASRPRIRVALLGALVSFGTVHLLYEMRPLVRERIADLRADGPRLAVASALASMTRPEGTILAQDLGLVLAARRAPGIADPLVLSTLAEHGAWDPERLAPGIREGRYDAIVLDRPLESITDRDPTTSWIAPLKDEVARAYRLADVLSFDAAWHLLEPERYVYRPRTGSDPFERDASGDRGTYTSRRGWGP